MMGGRRFSLVKPLYIAILLLALTGGIPAAAAECILDYEAFVIRSALPDDATTIEEQSATNYGWYTSGGPLNILDHSYERSGPTRMVAPDTIEFYALEESVPLFRDAGSTEEVPGTIYASVDPETCEVQPYVLAE
jgi:hypothetical protein